MNATLPFWAYFIAPVFGNPNSTAGGSTAAARAVILASTLAWSCFVHARGAWSWDTQLWNSTPTPAYAGDRHRLWKWSDLQFLRGGDADFDDLYPDTGVPAVSEADLCIYPSQ